MCVCERGWSEAAVAVYGSSPAAAAAATTAQVGPVCVLPAFLFVCFTSSVVFTTIVCVCVLRNEAENRFATVGILHTHQLREKGGVFETCFCLFFLPLMAPLETNLHWKWIMKQEVVSHRQMIVGETWEKDSYFFVSVEESDVGLSNVCSVCVCVCVWVCSRFWDLGFTLTALESSWKPCFLFFCWVSFWTIWFISLNLSPDRFLMTRRQTVKLSWKIKPLEQIVYFFSVIRVKCVNINTYRRLKFIDREKIVTDFVSQRSNFDIPRTT